MPFDSANNQSTRTVWRKEIQKWVSEEKLNDEQIDHRLEALALEKVTHPSELLVTVVHLGVGQIRRDAHEANRAPMKDSAKPLVGKGERSLGGSPAKRAARGQRLEAWYESFQIFGIHMKYANRASLAEIREKAAMQKTGAERTIGLIDVLMQRVSGRRRVADSYTAEQINEVVKEKGIFTE
jgi:hypothetical protein